MTTQQVISQLDREIARRTHERRRRLGMDPRYRITPAAAMPPVVPVNVEALPTVWRSMRRFTKQIIVETVAAHFGVEPAALLSSVRRKDIVVPRHVAVYLLRQELHLSLSVVGRLFNRDHTTAIHSIRRVERLIAEDSEMRNAIERMQIAIRQALRCDHNGSNNSESDADRHRESAGDDHGTTETSLPLADRSA